MLVAFYFRMRLICCRKTPRTLIAVFFVRRYRVLRGLTNVWDLYSRGLYCHSLFIDIESADPDLHLNPLHSLSSDESLVLSSKFQILLTRTVNARNVVPL